MEKFLYENILSLQKSLCTLYLNGAIESSNDDVRKVMETGLALSLDLQDEIYQIMKDDGFYNVENLKESEIKKVCNKLC